MYKQISSKDTEKGAHPEDARRPEDPAEQNAGKITNCLKLVVNYFPPSPSFLMLEPAEKPLLQ